MLVEVGGGLGTHTGSQSIDGVAGEHGIDGTDIHLAGIAGLHKILHEGLHTEDDILEPLDLFQVMHKGIHLALTLGEVHLAVLVPEGIVAHHGIRFLHLLGLALEELAGEFVEGIVAQACGTDDDGFLQETGYLQFGYHIVGGQHPGAVGQLGKLLYDTQVLHKVHITPFGNGQFTAFHLIGGVSKYIEVSAEAEILLVVGQEMEVETAVTVHINRVFDIESVEGDGILADG